MGVGGALGAALGGALAEALGWRWEFGIQLPFMFIVTVVAALAVPSDIGLQEDKRRSAMEILREFDIKGSVLLTSCVTFLILGLNLGGNVLPCKSARYTPLSVLLEQELCSSGYFMGSC